jgi:transcriptional regulator with XRE-family HTH domain
MLDLTAPNVGQRIRAIRERRGLSLRALADICGLSTNAISLIERGENSPTVSSLHQLATALDVPITDFFKEDHEQMVAFIQPKHRLRSQINGIRLESLATGLRNQQIEPFLMQVEPGEGNIDQPVSHSGDEFVYCLEGEIEYWVGDQVYILNTGCSLLFKASQPHCFRNMTDSIAQLMMIFMVGEGTHHLTHHQQLDK